MNRPHVMFIISALAGGGAERVIVDLSHFLSEKGYVVTVATLEGDRSDHFPLHQSVRRLRTNIMWESRGVLDSALSMVKRLRLIRSLVRNTSPDVVVSFIEMTNVRVLLALAGTDIPVIVSERTDPRHHLISGYWSHLRRHSYRRAARLVVQTDNVARWARSWLSAKKVVIIPNAVRRPVDPAAQLKPSRMPHGRVLLGMGRLSVEKGFDLLVRAFAQAGLHRAGWSLVLLGEGGERGALTALAADLGVGENVLMPGIQANPAEWLQHADIFALSSRYEGFPNALLEAMQCGVASVAFDCESGPSEIIRDGFDGLLVPPTDVDGLSKALRRLALDAMLRGRLGANARSVTERFSQEFVYGQWQALLNSVIAEFGPAGCKLSAATDVKHPRKNNL